MVNDEECVEETKEHFESLKRFAKIDYEKTSDLLHKYRDNIFNKNLSDEDREMLYLTIRRWEEESWMYYNDRIMYLKIKESILNIMNKWGGY